MRVVRDDADLARALESAAAEAQSAFGDSSLYAEKFIEHARHVEIQLLADSTGNVVHLGERDCSTQRRHQKLIEEAPSPAIGPILRAELAQAAILLAQRVHYQGAGTVEFLFDEDTQRWYFLEMNTRIQVEHPVTEMVTGRDIVVEQIRIAAGVPLSFGQSEVTFEGHAIECRVNAEDPARNFMPGPGLLRDWKPPEGSGLRVDTHCYAGYLVPPFYDSLLAKVIVHADTRDRAIEKMRAALDGFEVAGVPTTIPFHRQVLTHEDFRSARVTTRWVEGSSRRCTHTAPASSCPEQDRWATSAAPPQQLTGQVAIVTGASLGRAVAELLAERVYGSNRRPRSISAKRLEQEITLKG
jgi:acetyl-CoA carboxylase biotin carboxylase subunit